MLEDAAGIRRVVLACGTVDFRKGLMGCPRNTQEAADLIEEQFHYLMMGLNPLHLKVKEVAPEKYIEMVV